MPLPPKPIAESYDDILRRTVVEPDSSFRPSKQQLKDTSEGKRALDQDEQALHDRVLSAISSVANVDASRIDVEVTRDRVTLRGGVGEASAFDPIERAVQGVTGVREVVNQLVVESA